MLINQPNQRNVLAISSIKIQPTYYHRLSASPSLLTGLGLHLTPPQYVASCKSLHVYVALCVCPFCAHVSFMCMYPCVYVALCKRPSVCIMLRVYLGSFLMYTSLYVWIYLNGCRSYCVRKYLVLKITFFSNKLADLVPRLTGNTFEFWLGLPQGVNLAVPFYISST